MSEIYTPRSSTIQCYSTLTGVSIPTVLQSRRLLEAVKVVGNFCYNPRSVHHPRSQTHVKMKWQSIYFLILSGAGFLAMGILGEI